MPFDIQPGPNLLKVAMRGALTARDVQAYAREVSRLEEASAGSRNLLTDFSQVEAWHLEADEMQAFASMRASAALKNRVKSAIVASRNIDFGMGRMFELMVRNPSMEVRVFRDVPSALQWLETPVQGSGPGG